METIRIDSGYSSVKFFFDGKWRKVPSSIAYNTDIGITVGETKDLYKFEGEEYTIGKQAINEEAFTTTDFKFKHKFEPLIIKYIRDLCKIDDKETVNIVLSLALVDWRNQDKLRDRCREFVVNDVTIHNNISIIPQGIGAFYDFVSNTNNGNFPDSTYLIDIGYSTINVVYLLGNTAQRSNCKGYPNHGVSSIIKPFTNYLETTFSMAFSEQEAIRYFIQGQFKYNGEIVEAVSEKIKLLKSQFIKKLFQSILIQDKKSISTSDTIVLAGGGCYYLDNVKFPFNCKFVNKPYEFSNLRGMVYITGDEFNKAKKD